MVKELERIKSQIFTSIKYLFGRTGNVVEDITKKGNLAFEGTDSENVLIIQCGRKIVIIGYDLFQIMNIIDEAVRENTGISITYKLSTVSGISLEVKIN